MSVVSTSSNNEWQATFNTVVLIPHGVGVPDDIVPWKVVITAQDASGPTIVTDSDSDASAPGNQPYTVHIDQVIPALSNATKTGDIVQVQFSEAMKVSSLSTSDFRLIGDTTYTPVTIDTSKAGTGSVGRNFSSLGVP